MLAALFCAGSVLAAAAAEQVPVIITLDSKAPAAPVTPEDFVGLSFGMKTMLPASDGSHFFSPTNKALITLFQNVGLRHLRMGGTTVESPPSIPIPDVADIDEFFSFVRAAGVQKVVYSLRLLETNSALNYAATNAAIAKHIWDHHREYLDCFSIGNEPNLERVFNQDVAIINFDSYLRKWRLFAAAITNAVPEARFAGPDAASGNIPWTVQFAEAEGDSDRIKYITEHFYVGGRGKDVEPAQGISRILSPRWVIASENLYRRTALPLASRGLRFRFTEANDHYSGGVSDASNTFAGALWALDFLHWWAAHAISGVDFHNTQWVVNDVITPGADGQLTINPKGYGLKAFQVSGHGAPEALNMTNAGRANLTAYSVRGDHEHFVTLINKEHGTNAPVVMITLNGPASSAHAEKMSLIAPHNDASSKSGVTLGGASIVSNTPWKGTWTQLKPDDSGRWVIPVPPTSAVIVKISTE